MAGNLVADLGGQHHAHRDQRSGVEVLVKISFRLDTSTVASDEFLDTAEWALREGLMTEDQLMDVVAAEILSNVKVVEEQHEL